jgi:D-alanine-D-alanine ligase
MSSPDRNGNSDMLKEPMVGISGEAGMLVFREDVLPADCRSIARIVRSSGFFSEEEVTVAVELACERLEKGVGSGYRFLFAELFGGVVGYTCFGPVPCTQNSYDLYWIAVHNDFRHLSVGRQLLGKSEEIIAKHGGRRIYVETSSRAIYRPTRQFYRTCGYVENAVLEDYYAPGDGKVIYIKVVAAPGKVANDDSSYAHKKASASMTSWRS